MSDKEDRSRDLSEQVLKEIEVAYPDITPLAVIPGQSYNKKLGLNHKMAILKWFAAGFSSSEVQKRLFELARVTITQTAIIYYRERYAQKISELRKDIFGEDFEHIPIAHKSVRLARYEDIYHRLMSRGRLLDAKKVLEDARVEKEGKEPLIRTGDICPTQIIGDRINVDLTKTENETVDGIILEALERENSGKSSALVGKTSPD